MDPNAGLQVAQVNSPNTGESFVSGYDHTHRGTNFLNTPSYSMVSTNSPVLTMGHLVQTTPVVGKSTCVNDSSIFAHPSSDTKFSMGAPGKVKSENGYTYRSARRNLRDMSFGQFSSPGTSYPSTNHSSPVNQFYDYQDSPHHSGDVTEYSHNYDPSFYYNKYYDNVNSYDSSFESGTGSEAFSSPADESASSTYDQLSYPCFDYTRTIPTDDKSQIGITNATSPGNKSTTEHMFNESWSIPSSVEDSGNGATLAKSETSSGTENSVNEDETSDEDGGILIGTPVLYSDGTDAVPEKASTPTAHTFLCHSCVCGSGSSTDNTGSKTQDTKPIHLLESQNRDSEYSGSDKTEEGTVHGSFDAERNGVKSRRGKGKRSLDVNTKSGQGLADVDIVQVNTLELEQKGSHLCLGCQKPVFDRYVLHVKDHGYWHAECLKCSNCQDNLSTHKSCYVKNEQVFCRNDYNILFGLSCVKCSLQFKKEQDWMRVAGQHRYHIACFLCKICKRQLGNNEKYHLVNGTDIYCTNHYRDMVNGDNSDGQQPPKKAKRNRTSYTETQIKFLQDRFLRDSNPDGGELEKIAKHIGLKKRVVQVWFQNNRARLKKSANNTKGGNQENKNPTNGNGVAGPTSLHDLQSMDWDNSLDPSSLDEQPYATPSPQQQGRPNHFDSGFGMSTPVGGPLMCLPTCHNSAGPSSLGEGGSLTNCDTPREQMSPQFSDLATPSAPPHETPSEDLTRTGNHECPSTNGVCSSELGSAPHLPALRSSVLGDKYPEPSGLKIESLEHQQLRRMMTYHEQRQHPPLHHVDSPYGLYGGYYNMYSNGYGSMYPLSGEHCSSPDSFLGHRDPHLSPYHGSSHEQLFTDSAPRPTARSSPPACFTLAPNGLTQPSQNCPSPPCHFSQGQGRGSGITSPHLFSHGQGYTRASCASPSLPGRSGQFGFQTGNGFQRNGGNSFFTDGGDSS
ncbi:uncharacterized protein LOC131928029 [Physella acuta]|uniref:uncharacterized protein LOC131928029 n=1 Tax=Physella acuta TaxID=109671 RepID=UPI0027DDF813|nr:uncharacterized protein LOC131928029 [Physella acuta]